GLRNSKRVRNFGCFKFGCFKLAWPHAIIMELGRFPSSFLFWSLAMKSLIASVGLALFLAAIASTSGDEARLVRYPHYHNGKVAFTYMGDIWTANENGTSVQRLTAHRGRDTTPRFSPDGKWIAFSSDREGNMDVWVMPTIGGTPKQLTYHSS